MFSTHALATVQTVIQTTPWCAVRSGCNQRNSTAQRQRGTLVSMSARCLNQTSWSSSLRPSRRNLAPRNPVTLPQRSGKLCVALCTALLWLPLGRGPQFTWLVWSQINCDDPCHWSQANCPGRVQTHTQWEEPTDSQDCQEQGSADCSALRKRILDSLRAKTKVREALIRDLLFVDNAAVTTHTQQELQALTNRFSQACKDFRLTISLKKTNLRGQDTMKLAAITIDDYELDVVEQFTYLGSTITDNLSLDAEINKRIEKATTTLACLTSRVWTNPKLTVKTQDGSVQRLCRQHTDVRQRDVDHMCQTRKKTQFLPPEKHPLYPGHILARQCPTPKSCPSQPSKYVCPAQTVQAALAGSCLPHGRWPHPKRHSVWRVSIWKENQRPPTAVLQGCLQERLESTWHQHQILGGPCSRPHDVEKHSASTPQVRGREAGECRSRKKGLQNGAQPLQQTRDHTQMQLLWQRLFLPHRSLQPQATATIEQQDNQDVHPWSNLINGGHSTKPLLVWWKQHLSRRWRREQTWSPLNSEEHLKFLPRRRRSGDYLVICTTGWLLQPKIGWKEPQPYGKESQANTQRHSGSTDQWGKPPL